MIPDIDIHRSAWLVIRRYGEDDAMLEATARADHLLEEGDRQDAATWHRILAVIERPA